ncbi:MAG: glycosyltransferase family 2 protein [Flavobacteriales bacterium]|nr:MAG: glycosyltransferase family 2 protein [Flavobacteriales bacterium]
MKVAIVILNWNGKKILEQFLPSVLEYSQEATIYIADNASTDESIPFLKERFNEVIIIQNKTNGGFAKGYNDALINITEDLLILINNDVEVTKNWLEPIINEFKSDSSLIAAQPKILDFNNKKYFEYAGAGGGFIDQLGYPYCRGRIFNTIEKDMGQYNDIKKIFWATGACLIIKNNEFKKLNGFDENFFAHQEEIDLCWRIQLTGGTIKYIGNSTVYHVGGATLSNLNPTKTFYNFRNSLLMLVKNIKSPKVYTILLTRLLLDGIAGLHFLIQGKWKHTLAIIKAHLSFYRLLPSYINKKSKNRKQIKYYHIKSIVWNYFIRKNRIFKEVN